MTEHHVADRMRGTADDARHDAAMVAGRARVSVLDPPEGHAKDVREIIGAVWGPQQEPQDILVRALRQERVRG